jgi:hypothetical protein
MARRTILEVAALILLGACVDMALAAGMKPYEGKLTTGFTIPQIDLNDREEIQVVVCRDPKVYTGHPSSVLLDDGRTMLIVYLDRHGRGRINWQRSKDGGKTWSKRLPLPKGWDEPVVVGGKKHDPWLEVPIMYKINGADGKQRVCVYTAGRGIGPARYAVSDDRGKTWSGLKAIMAGGKPIENTVVLFSDMIRLKDGSYMATWHGPRGQVKAATQDGIRFSEPRLIATHNRAFLCEGCFIRSPDGKRIALLLRENARRFNSFICFSDDEGMTWTTPRELPGALTGDRHQHTYAPDGRLFISFRDRAHKTSTFGDWVGWVGTFEDLEEGREGQYRVRLKDNHKGADCAYPTQHLLPDGTIFAATYGCWQPGQPNYILSFRLKMAELDRLWRDAR